MTIRSDGTLLLIRKKELFHKTLFSIRYMFLFRLIHGLLCAGIFFMNSSFGSKEITHGMNIPNSVLLSLLMNSYG